MARELGWAPAQVAMPGRVCGLRPIQWAPATREEEDSRGRVLMECGVCLPAVPPSPPWAPHPSYQRGLLCSLGYWGLLGRGPHHIPLLYPQLQQTEAELRKVDEAIALFQKML